MPYIFWRRNIARVKRLCNYTLGVLTLLVTSAAVYGILTINTQIQAKPESQIKIPDYTAELDSLKSQVDSIHSQISSISNNLAAPDTPYTASVRVKELP